jgi:acetyltransferase-like isoleucine patch superfamily enzyme
MTILNRIKRLLLNPLLILRFLKSKIKSTYYSCYIDEGNGKFIIQDSSINIKINKGKGSKLIINGDVMITSHIGGNAPAVINLGINSILEIGGDFIIGNGVKLAVNDEAFLSFGGKDIESGSGITADSIIMCHKKIKIGKDFLCAWGVFITDSDWHSIGSQNHQSDVIIGNHVWIANNSSVLKGSIIGDNSIIASQSKVINKSYPPNSMLAGSPAKVVKSDVTWCRDI